MHFRRAAGAALAAAVLVSTTGFDASQNTTAPMAVPAQNSDDTEADGAEADDAFPESNLGRGTRPFQVISQDTSSNFWILVSTWMHAEDNSLGDSDSHMGIPEQNDVEDDITIGDFDQELRAIGNLLRAAQNDHLSAVDDKGLTAGYTPSTAGAEPIEGREDDREASHEAWVAAVEELPIEDIEDHSEDIVEQARLWQLHGESATQACEAPVSTGDSDDDDEDSTDDSGDGDGVEIPSEYEDYVQAAAEESGFPVELLAAQIEQESGWDPDATSPVGAQGIAQFMPSTWAEIGEGDISDPEASIAAQGRYMKQLREQVEPNADSDEHVIELTLAAYNSGLGNVESYGWQTPPFAETQDYVVRIPEMAGDGVSLASTDCAFSVDADPPDDLECAPLDDHDYLVSVDNLKPQTLFALQCGVEAFPEFTNWGGTRNDPGSDHHVGGALDLMLGPDYLDDEWNEYGWESALWWKEHADYFDITYIIFDDEWWTCWGDSDEWQPYGPPGGHSDDTQAHKDHPHLSFDRVNGINIGDCPQHEDADWG